MNASKFLALLPLAASSAWGCDNPFGYSYLAETIKPGQVEIVQWVTGRIGRDLGNGYDARYRGFDLKTEVEWGISPNEQLAVYVNSRYLERTARNGLLFDGFQIAYKRMLSNPDTQDWGVALYIEPGYSQVSSKNGAHRDQLKLETKLLLQHNFGANDEWVYAANIIGELEHETATHADTVKLKLTQGLARAVGANWYVGAEAILEAEWSELNNHQYTALLAGPCVRYQRDGFFVRFTALAQVTATPANKGDLNVTKKSPYEGRLLFGYEF
ncbi:MAG: hypothetical protein CK522_01560 [Opitutia bacterium]|nr:MAG: hypothetical protein CK522_01560 [Opitutae bacterium]